MERIAVSGPGRLEVSGRWHGVRGRRFVRPTLTLTRAGDDKTIRALAELDHKPWAARDGEVWTAAFAVDIEPAEASAIELAVAPDITVSLAGGGDAPAKAGSRRQVAAGASAPRAKSSPEPPGPEPPGAERPGPERRRKPDPARPGGPDVERLKARMADAAEALDRERERRSAAERALETERAGGRQLRIELGQLRAELELARAGQAEATEAATELERLRRELLEAQHRLEQLTRERDRAARAAGEIKTALHERVGALESAREALESERAQTGRLREQLTDAHQAVGDSGTPVRPSREPAARPEVALRAPRADVAAGAAGAAGAPGPDGGASRAPQQDGSRAPIPPAPRSRPVNPSLRHRSYWAGRLLALLVLAAVIIAVVLVIQGTVSH